MLRHPLAGQTLASSYLFARHLLFDDVFVKPRAIFLGRRKIVRPLVGRRTPTGHLRGRLRKIERRPLGCQLIRRFRGLAFTTNSPSLMLVMMIMPLLKYG